MGLQFHETGYGKRFFDVQLPSLIKAVERLADANGKQQAAEPAVDTTANMVYVCYEENSNELAIENGAINEMCVASSLNDVYQWIRKRWKEAEQNSYTVLNDMEASEFYKELMASRECALHLYHNGDEDSRLYYALTVKPFILPQIKPARVLFIRCFAMNLQTMNLAIPVKLTMLLQL